MNAARRHRRAHARRRQRHRRRLRHVRRRSSSRRRASARSNRATIETAIRTIRLGGDTCISCGLEKAMQQLAQTSLAGDRVNRMILLSDGATNSGIRTCPASARMAGRMRDRGVHDLDHRRRRRLRREGHGRARHRGERPPLLRRERERPARRLRAGVRRAPRVRRARQPSSSSSSRPASRSTRCSTAASAAKGYRRSSFPFGTFSAKQEKTVLVKLRVPADRDGASRSPTSSSPTAISSKSDDRRGGRAPLVVKSDGSAQGSRSVRRRARRAQPHRADAHRGEQALRGRARREAREDARDAGDLSSTRARRAGRWRTGEAPTARALGADFEEQLGAVAEAKRTSRHRPATATAGRWAAACGGGTAAARQRGASVARRARAGPPESAGRDPTSGSDTRRRCRAASGAAAPEKWPTDAPASRFAGNEAAARHRVVRLQRVLGTSAAPRRVGHRDREHRLAPVDDARAAR